MAQSALLAQWLERAAVNRKVTGSIPVGSVVYFFFEGRLLSLNFRQVLSYSEKLILVVRSIRNRVYSSAVERLTADQQVPGSNPGAPYYTNANGASISVCIYNIGVL